MRRKKKEEVSVYRLLHCFHRLLVGVTTKCTADKTVSVTPALGRVLMSSILHEERFISEPSCLARSRLVLLVLSEPLALVDCFLSINTGRGCLACENRDATVADAFLLTFVRGWLCICSSYTSCFSCKDHCDIIVLLFTVERNKILWFIMVEVEEFALYCSVILCVV